MGGFSGLGEKIWGGNNNSAQKTTERQQEYSRRFTQQSMGQARADTNTLYDRGDFARNYGYNQALDIYGQAMPIQADYFQGGNIAAQQAVLGGQPMIYQAPRINPGYFQQEQFRMPMYGSPEFENVPMLTQSIGWQNSVPKNVQGNVPIGYDPYAQEPVDKFRKKSKGNSGLTGLFDNDNFLRNAALGAGDLVGYTTDRQDYL